MPIGRKNLMVATVIMTARLLTSTGSKQQSTAESECGPKIRRDAGQTPAPTHNHAHLPLQPMKILRGKPDEKQPQGEDHSGQSESVLLPQLNGNCAARSCQWKNHLSDCKEQSPLRPYNPCTGLSGEQSFNNHCRSCMIQRCRILSPNSFVDFSLFGQLFRTFPRARDGSHLSGLYAKVSRQFSRPVCRRDLSRVLGLKQDKTCWSGKSAARAKNIFGYKNNNSNFKTCTSTVPEFRSEYVL